MRKSMIKRMKRVIAGMCCIFLLCPVFLISGNAQQSPEGLYAQGAVLMDGESGRVLFEKNGSVPYAMASTTKIMTCILALEMGDARQIVTFSKYAASMPDVQMNAKEGERYYLKDLLYSTMLESYNDCAVAVAEAIGGSVEGFAKLMNAKAEAIGCENTHFVTPNGLDGEDEQGAHTTTAKDLALILRYCIQGSSKSKEFLEITGTPIYEFHELDGKRYISCQNRNSLLTTYDGAFTGKTGFTGKAGYCYTGAAKREGETMIIALLGSGWYPNKSYKWKDAKKLLDYGFEQFSYVPLGKSKWELPAVKVSEGMSEEVKLSTNATDFTFLLGKEETVQCKINYTKILEAPVEKGMTVGNISYELNGKEIEKFDIYTAEEVEKENIRNKLKKWIRNIVEYVEKCFAK